MYILFDGNTSNPEIEISDSYQELSNFGKQLIHINEDMEIKSQYKKSNFYPKNIKYLSLKVKHGMEEKNLVDFLLMREKLIFEGTKNAFLKLGQSIFNNFDETSITGDHIHLDYFEGNDLVAATNCHIILLCD